MQVDVTSGKVPSIERWYILGFATASSLGAAAVINAVPIYFLDFDINTATGQLNEALSDAVQRLSSSQVRLLLFIIWHDL